MLKYFRWISGIKEPYTLYLVVRDPRTKVHIKIYAAVIIALMIVYVLSPIDIVPDMLPLLGWLDDIVLIPVAFMFIEKILPQDLLVDNRNKANRRVNRAILVVIIGASALLVLWATIITAAVFTILKLING